MAKFLNILKLRGFTTAADTAVEISGIDDDKPRLKIDAGGKHTWGDGTLTGDTTLYRSGPDELKTDDTFVAAGGLTVSGYQIDTTNATTNDVLTFDGTAWSGASLPAINSLDDIADVDVTSAVTSDVLTYNGSIWVGASVSTVAALDDLTDVNAPTPSDGDVLTWRVSTNEWVNLPPTGGGGGGIPGTSYTTTVGNGSSNVFTVTHGLGTRDVYVVARQVASPYDNVEVLWSATTTNAITVDFSTVPDSNSISVTVYSAVTGTPVTTTLSALTDVALSSPTSGNVLEYNGSSWVNSVPAVNQMSDSKMMAIITMDIGA
jgi:hypothetical protein